MVSMGPLTGEGAGMLMGAAAEWGDSETRERGMCCVEAEEVRGVSHLLSGCGACRTRECYWQLTALFNGQQ